jgi:dTDP-4-dehydrorhamnose 3,5-epimerase
MDIRESAIAGVAAVSSNRHTDARGSFARWFCQQELARVLGERQIVQINHSVTAAAGAVRGMHFQHPPAAEMKLVRCLRGAVFDVAVDLRAGSPTLLAWHGETLRAGDDTLLVIPEGCAHGFQALEPDTELLYLHTAPYEPAREGALRFDDPSLGIEWPLAVTEVSERDRSHALIGADFTGIRL